VNIFSRLIFGAERNKALGQTAECRNITEFFIETSYFDASEYIYAAFEIKFPINDKQRAYTPMKKFVLD
jgi:hypothetical protein